METYIPYLVTYLSLVVARLYAVRETWKVSTFRGAGWLFNFWIGDGPNREAGAALLRQLRLRLIVPELIIEAICLTDFLRYGTKMHFLQVQLLATVAFTIARRYALQMAKRESKALLQTAEEQPARVAVSLEPRQIGRYSNPVFEILLGIVMLAGIGIIAVYYPQLPSKLPITWDSEGNPAGWMEKSFNMLLLPALFLLYAQIGALCIKREILRCAAVLPGTQTEEYVHYREEARRLPLLALDFCRGLYGVFFLLRALRLIFWQRWSELVKSSPATAHLLGNAYSSMAQWLGAATSLLLFIVVVGYLLVYSGRLERLLEKAREFRPTTPRTRPVERAHFWLGGIAYFNPENPSLWVVGGPRWVAVNLADKRFYFYAMYLTGFIAILLKLPQ